MANNSSIKKDSDLSESDVRDIVRLLGENIALEGDITDKRRHLMAGICRLVKADSWAWVQVAKLDATQLPVYVGFIHDGFSDDEFAKYLAVQAHPDMAWMTAPLSRQMEEKKKHLTRPLQQIVTMSRFNSADVHKLWKACGFYPRIISFYPVPEGVMSGIAIYRRCGSDLCTEREAKIVHILTAEVPWLHTNQTPKTVLDGVPKLPVRQRLALELLLQGKSRKAIANYMAISINTVAGYIRDIYHVFGVTSQAQLIRRFYQGDGDHTN
jgi:DNA-binding CsgD family transcriptional regulator